MGKVNKEKLRKTRRSKKYFHVFFSRQNLSCCQVAHEPRDFLSFTHRDGRPHKDSTQHRQEAKTTEEESDTKTCKLGREKKRLDLPGENDPDPNIWTKQ